MRDGVKGAEVPSRRDPDPGRAMGGATPRLGARLEIKCKDTAPKSGGVIEEGSAPPLTEDLNFRRKRFCKSVSAGAG